MLTFLRNNSLFRNPYFIFLPFLLLYCAFVLIQSENKLVEDELRYYFFAKNLTQGYYWYPGSPIALANGPGYPILLAPFIALDLPLIYLKLINAILQYLSVIFLFKALRQIVPTRIALIVSLFWACYYNFFEFMAVLYSETLSTFLVSLLVYFLTKAFNQNIVKKEKYIYLSGFIIGYLALTKVIFGYVIIFMLVVSAILWLIKRNSVNYRKGLIITSIAFITTLPYLIYTYKSTGKAFYWSSVGGDNLYWMSTPYSDEYGSWFWFEEFEANNSGEKMISFHGLDSLRAHHQKVWDEVKNYDEITRDDALKKKAINNIKSHPAKFLQNCMSNIGRFFFNYPYSYTFQKPSNLLRLPFNGIILALLLFSVIPTLMNWEKIIFPVRFMIFFVFLYLGGSILGSAETRMFTITVPILSFWITFILHKTIKVKLIYK